MNKYPIFPGLLLLFFLGCSEPQEPPRVPEDYSTWKTTHEGFLEYPIPGHMDNFRKIYISPNIEELKANEECPDGTVIIKEIYKRATMKDPIELTVMVKDRNHEKALGGWLWIVKDPVSGTENIVNSEFCFTCHSDANVAHPYGDKNPEQQFRDYVFIPLFSNIEEESESAY